MDQYNQGFNSEEMFNAESASNQEQGPNQPKPEIYVPLANIVRIMRRILPSHAKITDEAKETMQVCVSEFINHVTAEANRKRYDEHRETINSEDLIASMAQLRFSEYVEPLSMMLNRVRSQERTRASPYTPVARTRVRNQVNPQVMARGTRALNVNPPQPSVDNAPPPAQNDGVHESADDDLLDYDKWFFGDDGEGGSSSGNNL